MDSATPPSQGKGTVTHHPENWVILEDQPPKANNAPQSTASTETEAIMRYIELLERTRTQLQKTERIMDKLSGQLGSAIAVTEEQVKGRKPLQDRRDGGNV